MNQIIDKHSCDNNLSRQLLLWVQTFGPLHHNLNIIIQKSDDPKSYGHKQNRNDLGIIPDIKQGGYNNAGQNHQPAHGRRTLLLKMCLRSVAADLLPELKLVEKWYYNRTEHCADGKSNYNR